MRKFFKDQLNKLPYIKGLHAHYRSYRENSCYPPGHYYSPIVAVNQIKQRQEEVWKDITSDKLEGVDLNVKEQEELLLRLLSFYPEMPFESNKKDNLRYYFDNEMFSYTDGIVLYSLLRHLNPGRIIEVGSGYSSALMLDVNQLFLNNSIDLHFIEPYPERLYNAIKNDDQVNVTIKKNKVQEIPLSYFEQLRKGDILFIDSTHVSKTGSDVNYIFFEILPRIRKGVWVHFHDIFYPFEYPKAWVYHGRNWNENYILRAFLSFNQDFKIKLFPHYLHLHKRELFEGMPLCYKNRGGSIWIERIN